jgi:hypothetical protein
MNPCGKIIPKFDFINRLRFIGAVIFIFLLTNTAYGQAQGIVVDSTKIGTSAIIPDSLITDSLSLDSLVTDSLAADSANKIDLQSRLGIIISSDALPSVVTSEARDSAVLDMSQNIFYLYGSAKVNYEDLQLEAGEITYNQGGNMVVAAPSFDSIGISKNRPMFTQGAEKFTYDSLQYNFKSKRAIVRNVRSQYGEGYMFSEQVKRNPDQSIYGLHSIYTTCALDTPHFGIYAKKIKVIPGKVAATGPANIAIEQVPTPLFLPFGLFPITQGQRSGFRLPTYTVEAQRGLGLINGGYYFNISEYVDLLMQTNFYSKGSYGVSGVSTYTNRYHYAGGISFSYAYNKIGESYEPNASISKDFLLNWQHHSDAKSRPGVRFDASVNAGTSSFYALNTYTVNQLLTNQYNSNITYTKSWQNKPISLSVGARHSQNTLSGLVEVTLPEVNFYVSQFNPFQSKNSTGTHWYDKITTQYTLNAINRINFYDSSFSFNRLGINDFQNGLVQTIPINATYNVLRFINLGINATYKEYWLTQKVYQVYNPSLDKVDSTMYRGFYAARDFTTGLTANTRIYGVKMFKHGKLMGIRHVLSPNASLTFAPDYATDPFNYGYRTYINPTSNTYEYRSAFDGSVVGTPGNQYGQFSSLLGFGIDNNLQIKVRSKDSTGFKNVRLIDNFRIGTTYDLAKDSFNWSPIAFSFATNILEKVNITAAASWDPYVFDYNLGRRTQEKSWNNGKGLGRFQGGNITAQASFHSIQKKDKNKNPNSQSEEFKRMMQYGRYDDYVDFNIPWNLNMSYSLQMSNSYRPITKKDSLILNNTMMFGGDFNLTPQWKIAVNSGYNITEKQLQLTSIDIYRDLHCWEMRLGAVPFGPRKNYNFTLNVKASVLQDLKLLRRRDFRDAL